MPVRLQSTSGDEGDDARIEIIPLIDIMFFLLAAFMLVSLSMTQLHRVPVSIPEASTGIPDTASTTIVIAIDANGLITLNQKIITLSEITTHLKDCKEPKKSSVLISADAEARHKQVLGVLNSIREAGVEKVSFESAKNHS
ncbi:MAG: biopolymer transporter ExbD [Akkermansiaceae bacterium]|nr:biopolymer transporter ExbD [Akkermansiaceae bacterium]